MSWRRGEWKRDAAMGLWCTWVHSNGCQIWQGRPFTDDPRRFIYRLKRADGSTTDHRLLTEAKRAAE